MKRSIREERQKEAMDAYLSSDRRSILCCCPRFGKIRVAAGIISSLNARNVLLLYPRNDIYTSWESEFLKIGKSTDGMERSTFKSIPGTEKKKWDLIIVDEIHEMSINQQKSLSEVAGSSYILGLTGTLTQKTANELFDNLGMDICYRYGIDDGVREGILTDYRIFIHTVPLDDKLIKYTSPKGRNYTEKSYFNRCLYIRNNTSSTYRIELRMINIIQNSFSKMMKTKELLKRFSEERVLVFCGVRGVADKLGIPVYHSGNKDWDVFDDFCKGRGHNHLATIKMMQSGITILPISKGIINYMSGNPEDGAQKICRFLGLEYNNPDKKAEIHVISTDERFERERLECGLMFFDKSRIFESG